MARLPEDVSAYAGRWVALVSGRVAGVGYTANEALRLARRNRPKARISLRYVEPAGGEALQLSSMLERIEPVLLQQEMPVYLVGGAVRDALLGELNYDLDFVVPEGAVGLAFRVADALGVPNKKESLLYHLRLLSQDWPKGHWLCPCGSGALLRHCHRNDMMDMHQKIPPPAARRMLKRMKADGR